MQAIQMGFESVVSQGQFPGELLQEVLTRGVERSNVVGSFRPRTLRATCCFQRRKSRGESIS